MQKIIFQIIISLILFPVIFVKLSNAQELPIVIIYEKDGCEYCEKLNNSLFELDLNSKVLVIHKNISNSDYETELSNTAASCNVNPQTPLTVFNNECSIGYSASLLKIKEIAGFELDTLTEESENSEVIVENKKSEIETEEKVSTPVVETKKTEPEYNAFDYFFILAIPFIFTFAAYKLVTRLKL